MRDHRRHRFARLLKARLTRRTLLKGTAAATLSGVPHLAARQADLGGGIAQAASLQRQAGPIATLPSVDSDLTSSSLMASPVESASTTRGRLAAQVVPTDAIRFTQTAGYFPRRGSASGLLRSAETLAFESSRSVPDDATDSGKLDTLRGIFVYRYATDTVVYTGIEHGHIRGVSDRWVLFVIAEDRLGEDYNSDGIVDETPIPGVYNVETGEITYLRVPRLRHFFYDDAWVRLADDRVIMLFDEHQEIALFDLASESLEYTSIIGLQPGLDGDFIAYSADGDKLHVHDLSSGRTINTDVLLRTSESPTDNEISVSGNWITFYTYEPYVGEDLNGDGEMTDVLGICNALTGDVHYVRYGDASTYVAGDRSYFTQRMRSDDPGQPDSYRLGAYELLTGETTFVDLPIWAVVLAVDEQRIVLGVSERFNRQDLNGDGYISDAPIAAFLSIPFE